ncbi:MAG: hypothetical protein M3O94_00030, partial [Actinomycetota bacterium]|nr:hypothetical protein [Actinomycetota bacterium]
VTDGGPLEPTAVGSFTEFLDVFGEASRFTMPEVRAAFANGVARAVIARTVPGRGSKASLNLVDDEGEQVVRLIARAEGAWGNRVTVRVTQVKTLSGLGVKYVNLEVALDGEVVETIPNLVMDVTGDFYLFDRVNAQSRLLVAVDPLMDVVLPAVLGSTPLDTSGARASTAVLKRGAAGVVTATAKRKGRSGDRLAVQISDGRASLSLLDATSAPSVILRARAKGPDGVKIRIGVRVIDPTTVHLEVTPDGGALRTTTDATTIDELVASVANDPDIVAEPVGAVLPDSLATKALARTVDVTVTPVGADPRVAEDLPTLDDLVGVTDKDVAFTTVTGATQLPDSGPGVALSGGRDEGPALVLADDDGDPVAEVRAVAGLVGSVAVQVTHAVSSLDQSTPVATLTLSLDNQPAEVFGDVTMDPDDDRYLPAVLGDSALVRAIDLFVPSQSTSTPVSIARATPLTGGASPVPDDYQDALDRLESAEEPELIVACAATQLDDKDVHTVHQQVVAHCTKMADLAKNRMGLGSVTAAEEALAGVSAELDHADDVRSDHFVLCTPAGSEGAVAGVLAHLDYFDSPTFKVVPLLGREPGSLTDSQLEQLISGNAVAVTKRKGLGVIVAKGLLTSGRQINVQRTADKAVRDVKAIAQVYVGRLNDEGSRNALKQQISALLLRMAADGAIVPSTDQTSPAFTVDVHATQADFANGIVRVDIAIRPVRAIDYINATILVRT